jgi:hypothetical protein
MQGCRAWVSFVWFLDTNLRQKVGTIILSIG